MSEEVDCDLGAVDEEEGDELGISMGVDSRGLNGFTGLFSLSPSFVVVVVVVALSFSSCFLSVDFLSPSCCSFAPNTNGDFLLLLLALALALLSPVLNVTFLACVPVLSAPSKGRFLPSDSVDDGAAAVAVVVEVTSLDPLSLLLSSVAGDGDCNRLDASFNPVEARLVAGCSSSSAFHDCDNGELP